MAVFDVDSMISRLLNVGMAGGRLTTQVGFIYLIFSSYSVI